MKVISKEVTGLRLVIYLESGEADSLMTLLYQTTSDLMLIANTLMAALKSSDATAIHSHKSA